MASPVLAEMPKVQVVTTSYPKPLPEWFQEYAATAAAKAGTTDASAGLLGSKKPSNLATVKEECPKCKNPTMEYYTMQLRSADEGQTVFYVCPACKHKFSVNT
jgi:DNA-directed RNA polymerase I subunit RPA12